MVSAVSWPLMRQEGATEAGDFILQNWGCLAELLLRGEWAKRLAKGQRVFTKKTFLAAAPPEPLWRASSSSKSHVIVTIHAFVERHHRTSLVRIIYNRIRTDNDAVFIGRFPKMNAFIVRGAL